MLRIHKKTVLIFLLLLTGCTAFPVVPSTPSSPQPQIQPPDSRLDWTQKESGAFIISGERVFIGMGVGSGTRNTLLLRSSADNQAQEEVAKILTDFTKTLAYSVLAHDVVDKDEIEAGVYAIANTTIADAVIVDHWQNQTSGQYYALCRLPLATFKSRLAAYTAFDQTTRQAMLSRADAWFDSRVRTH